MKFQKGSNSLQLVITLFCIQGLHKLDASKQECNLLARLHHVLEGIQTMVAAIHVGLLWDTGATLDLHSHACWEV